MLHGKTNGNARRSGVVAILVAASLVLLIGIVAIAVDGGLLQDNKRRLQATADAAALAAADVLYRRYPTLSSTNPDPGGDAAAAAQKAAADNGFAAGTRVTVTVNIPPQSGPFTGKIGYAEVLLTYHQPRYFSTIWGSAATPVRARAVAKAFWGGTGNGVIVLDPSVAHALDANGTGAVTVTGGAAMVVNSSDPASAARASGGGGLTAPQFWITGGYEGTLNGTVTTGTPPIPDPLAYLPVPSVTENGKVTIKNLGMGNKQYTLSPGRHTSLPNFNAGDVVIFQQASAGGGGIYYIDGGGFTSTGATIYMDSDTSGGVMIYNAPKSGATSNGISISGNPDGKVHLSALTSGPYAGILFWQARSSAVPLGISGNGDFKLEGTFYTANANLKITGNGDAVIGSQYISRTLNLGGNGNITIDYTDQGTARKREVRLVE